MSQQNQYNQEGPVQSSDQNINYIDIPNKKRSQTIVYQSPPKVGKKQIYSKNNEDHIEIEMEDLDPEPRISTYKRDYKPFKVVVLDPDTMQPAPLPPNYHSDISSRDENVNIVYFVPSPTTKEVRPKHYKESNHRPVASPRKQPYKPILRQDNNNSYYHQSSPYRQPQQQPSNSSPYHSPYHSPYRPSNPSPPQQQPPSQPYYPNDYRYSENPSRYPPPPPPPPELKDNRSNYPYTTPSTNQPNITLNTTHYPTSTRSQYHGYNNYCDNNNNVSSMHINRIDNNQRSFSTPSNVRQPLNYETNYPIDRNYRPSYESNQKYGVTYFHPKAKPHPERWEDSLRTYNGHEDMADVERRRRMKRQREIQEQERRLYYPRTPFTEEDLEMRRRQRLVAQNEFKNHLLADRSNSKGKTVEPEFYFPEDRMNNGNYYHHHHHNNNNNRSQSLPPSRSSSSYYINNTPYRNNNTHLYSHDNYNNNDSFSSSSSYSETSFTTPHSIDSYSDDSASITDEPQIQTSPLPHQRNPSYIPINNNNNNNNGVKRQANHQHRKRNHYNNNKHHHNHQKTAINKNRVKSPYKPSFNLSKTTYINRLEDDNEEPQPEPKPEPQIYSDEESEIPRRNIDISDNDDNDSEEENEDDYKGNTYDIPIIISSKKKPNRPTIEELKNKRDEVEKLKKENEFLKKYEEERTNDLLVNAYNTKINANTFTNPLAFVPNSSNYVQGVSNYDPNQIQNIALSSYSDNNNNNNYSKNNRSKKETPRKPLHADSLDQKHDHHGNHSIHDHNHSYNHHNNHHNNHSNIISPNKNQIQELSHSHPHYKVSNHSNRDSKGNTLNDISSIEPINESNVASNFTEVISQMNKNIGKKNKEKTKGKNKMDSDINDLDVNNEEECDNDEEGEKNVDYKKVIKHSPQMHFCSEHICCNPPITYYLNNDNLENVSVSDYSENDNNNHGNINENINEKTESKRFTKHKSDKDSHHSSKHSSKQENNHLLSQISHSHVSTDNDEESDDDISIDSINIDNNKNTKPQKLIKVDEELKKKNITFVKNGSDTKLKSPQQKTHSTSSDPTPSPERNPLINDDDGDSIHDKMQFDDMDSVLKELKELRKEKHLLKHHNEQLNALSHQLHLENKTMREILSKTQTSIESN